MLDAPQQLLNRVNPRVVYQQVRWRLAFQGLVRLLQPLATPLVIAEDLGCAGVHTTYPDAPDPTAPATGAPNRLWKTAPAGECPGQTREARYVGE